MEERVVPNSLLFNKKNVKQKKHKCPLSLLDMSLIDYKNLALLKGYISEKGKISPSRITGVSAKRQRKLQQAIKRARHIALLPYSAS